MEDALNVVYNEIHHYIMRITICLNVEFREKLGDVFGCSFVLAAFLRKSSEVSVLKEVPIREFKVAFNMVEPHEWKYCLIAKMTRGKGTRRDQY